jgi:uncharacterized membrane protein
LQQYFSFKNGISKRMEKFINPNYHVLLIHFPLGLVTIGILAEIISLFWKNLSLRSAARWMIVIGAFSSIITYSAGIYAFRDILHSPANPDLTWKEIESQTNMSKEQLEFIDHHIDFNSAGMYTIIAAVFIAIAVSHTWFARLYWLFLLAAIGAELAFMAGAWYGGEAVYRLGAAVLPQTIRVSESPVARGIEYYIQPLQSHIVVAGTTFAFGLAAFAFSIRRFCVEQNPQERQAGQDWIFQGKELSPVFWLLTFMISLLVAIFGFWSVLDGFSFSSLVQNLKDIITFESHRLSVHVLSGVTFIILSIIVAALVKSKPRKKAAITILAILWVITAALQLFIGAQMLYDSTAGPLFSMPQ